MNQISKRQGMGIERHFSLFGGAMPRARQVRAEIKGDSGVPLFSQEVNVPETWGDDAANIVASKYLYGDASKGFDPWKGGRETSAYQLVDRVSGQVAQWGLDGGYFASEVEAFTFQAELRAICLGQVAAFNSPVWFNVGLHRSYGVSTPGTGFQAQLHTWVEGTDQKEWITFRVQDNYQSPQGSACFIQSLSDDMGSIMDLARSEAMLFKFGSGTGTDLSTLRSTREKLSGGGKPSGPVSFLGVYDSIAGVIKSGGKTRRAAKMNTLRCHHPDILEFIRAKSAEERKARALIAGGFDGSWNGEAYASVKYQNVNLSVGVTDEFMDKAAGGLLAYPTVAVTTGQNVEWLDAREVLNEIALGTWTCGDPGVHYVDTMNRWHTCPNSGPINTSNPCSEYVFLDDSACNLASINLLKFRRDDGTFDAEGFRHAVRVMLTAQEILVGGVSYPTEKIAINSARFRPLGLGYANLGAYLMASGLPYDSDEARELAAAITALMHAEALLHSARMAEVTGPFDGFAENREPMMGVVRQHFEAAVALTLGAVPGTEAGRLARLASDVMNEARRLGEVHGYRNAQVTLIAPTGTIAFMMGCDTTGIEPDFALVKIKTLAGGGSMTIVNQTVQAALKHLGYEPKDIDDILGYIYSFGTVDGCELLKDEHRRIFDCANDISMGGHIRMMAAVQPFLSGAISKTVNAPHDCTPATIAAAYVLGWRLGLKALAIYRDGSKESQPLNAKTKGDDDGDRADDEAGRDGGDGVAPAPGGHGDLPQVIKAGDWYVPGEPGMHPAIRKLADDDCVAIPSDDPDLGQIVVRGDRLRALIWTLGPHRLPGEGTVEALGRILKPWTPAQLKTAEAVADRLRPARERLPETRDSVTHKFEVGQHEGYITAGMYPDGRLGELFVEVSKEGSTVGGLMDCLATMISIGLQYGVPLEALTSKLRHQKFEPSGFTRNDQIRTATSLVDYLAAWLDQEFPGGCRRASAGTRFTVLDLARVIASAAGNGFHESAEGLAADVAGASKESLLNNLAFLAKAAQSEAEHTDDMGFGIVPEARRESTGDACPSCGNLMVRVSKTCWSCPRCGDGVGGCGG
jgi:ribonucleoside-diphosphate reductase alpha chain